MKVKGLKAGIAAGAGLILALAVAMPANATPNPNTGSSSCGSGAYTVETYTLASGNAVHYQQSGVAHASEVFPFSMIAVVHYRNWAYHSAYWSVSESNGSWYNGYGYCEN